jgi:Rieske Fe-S protein
MSDTPVDSSKRTWLIASTCAGAVGAGFVATPFISTFQPSERAKAAGARLRLIFRPSSQVKKSPWNGAANRSGLQTHTRAARRS